MSGYNGGYTCYKRQTSRKSYPKHVVGEKAHEVLKHIDNDNPIMQLFHKYSLELDSKHDRFERIVKISRDITIESKRIIFLLHNTATDIEEKKDEIFKEAELRLNQLFNKFTLIAQELDGQDHYLYLKAYTNGLQEFLEAYSFFEYQRSGTISKVSDIISKFKFSVKNEIDGDGDQNESNQMESKEVALLCPAIEIMLGLGDFTGEMMRKCINNLGAGNIDDCFKTCAFVRNIYVGFLGLNYTGHILGRKLHVLKQSLSKMELVCYNIRVRGSEIPKHMLAAVVTSANEDHNDDDEGFY